MRSQPEGSEAERLEEAETLRLLAKRDGVKDVEREAMIDDLESAGDLVEHALKDHPVGAFRGEGKPPERKINPARIEKGWYAKAERVQRRILQKKLGSYRPEPTDPVNQKPHAKGVVEGRLFDPHPSSRVRKNDLAATRTIRAAIPASLPVKPPPAPPPPKDGRCWECYRPIRRSGKNAVRAGTKFCTDNDGECRTAYNDREADRAAQLAVYQDWWDSGRADRILSIHRVVANELAASADRCGIKDATFVAHPNGVMAVHANPLPPIVLPGLTTWAWGGRGYFMLHADVTATEVDGGTSYRFEFEPPDDGKVPMILIRFAGDPGPKRVEYVETGAIGTRLPPVTSIREAIVTNRVVEFLAAWKQDLAA